MGGKSGGSTTIVKKVKPPKAPPPPPVRPDARRMAAKRAGYAGRQTAENIRNENKGRGFNPANADFAIKRLTEID